METMAKQKIKVMVLMGGPSAEHEVSLATGAEILRHLDPKKYLVGQVTITKTGAWLLPKGVAVKSLHVPRADSTPVIPTEAGDMAGTADVVFVALHGKYGEDGTVQGMLESLGVPYTGSGVLASALGMDKPRSLALFRAAGLRVPDFQVMEKSESAARREQAMRRAVRRLGLPLVVKPADAGSSVGVAIVRKKSALAAAAAAAFRHADEIMIQKFVAGREMTCGVLERADGSLLPLPPIEIVPKKGEFYDYASKYADGGSDHIIPPPGVSTKKIREMQDAAMQAHRVTGCRGMSRTDFIMDKKGMLHILEINTIPGMTPTSLLPQAAAAMGITFPRLLDMLVESALQRTA